MSEMLHRERVNDNDHYIMEAVVAVVDARMTGVGRQAPTTEIHEKQKSLHST